MNRALEAIPPCLSELEAEVIKRRFGIGCPIHTVERLSQVYPVSQARLRGIEKQALKTLRLHLHVATQV